MTLVVSGMLNKRIASEMRTSEATVKIHRGYVMRKMEAESLVELLRLADKLKLYLVPSLVYLCLPQEHGGPDPELVTPETFPITIQD